MYHEEDKVREACARVGLACESVLLCDTYYVTDEASGTHMGKKKYMSGDEVMELVDKRETDHRWKAERLLHYSLKLLNTRETDFLQSISQQRRALSEKQANWLRDIEAGMEKAARATARRRARFAA
jgi:hypothetical protein